MGQEYSATLTVRNEDKKETEKIVKDSCWDGLVYAHQQGFSCFFFCEMRTNMIPELTDLIEKGIPFDVVVNGTYDDLPLYLYSRYDSDGNHQYISVDPSTENPPITVLKSLTDYPEALASYVKDYCQKVTPLPFETQEANVKVFKTKQLICHD